MRQLGFAGLGKMGAPMARRLLAAGHKLTVFDIDDVILASFEKAGARRAATLRELSDHSEIVFVSLPTPDIVRKCALGSDGIVEGSARIFVDMSTTGPRTAIEIAQGLGARGITSVDCPVSGGVKGATEGILSLMVSCPATTFEEIRPLLEHLGRPTLVADAPGAAQTLKLANNLLAACALAITSEACVFGVKAGLDPRVMCEVFSRSSGINTATLDKFPHSVLSGSFDFGFSTGLAYKDVRLCLDEAEALGVPTPVGSAVRQVLAVTQAMFGPDSDFTSMVRPLEGWAGVEARSTTGAGEAEGRKGA